MPGTAKTDLRRLASIMLVSAAFWSAPGCQLNANVPQENPDCAFDGNEGVLGETGEDAGVFEGPQIELGELDGKDFVAWNADESVNTLVGPQGLEMLVPHVRVIDGAVGIADDEEDCLSVKVRIVTAGDDPDSAILQGQSSNAYTFHAQAGDWFAGPIWVPFDGLFVMGQYDLEVTVEDDTAASRLVLRIDVNAE